VAQQVAGIEVGYLLHNTSANLTVHPVISGYQALKQVAVTSMS